MPINGSNRTTTIRGCVAPPEGDRATSRPAGPNPLGSRSTPLRRTVLRTLEDANAPLSAYELAARLAVMLGRRLSPPTVYRALHILREQKLVVRIESLNKYMAVSGSVAASDMVFCICDRCHSTEIRHNRELSRALDHSAAETGFHMSRWVMELQGLCARCQESETNQTVRSI